MPLDCSICTGPNANAWSRARFNGPWTGDGADAFWIVDPTSGDTTVTLNILNIDVLTGNTCCLLTGTNNITLFDGVTTLTEGGANITVTRNGKSLTVVGLFTTAPVDGASILLTFITTCGTVRIGVGTAYDENPCVPQYITTPCREPAFFVKLPCPTDLCSTDCGDLLVLIDGVQIGYYDQNGDFVFRSDTYTQDEYPFTAGMYDPLDFSFSFIVQPGVLCTSVVTFLINGVEYGADPCNSPTCSEPYYS